MSHTMRLIALPACQVRRPRHVAGGPCYYELEIPLEEISMGTLGWQEMMAIFILALILFGPKKLPELGRTLGKAMSEFRRASTELKAQFDGAMKSIEQWTEPI